MKYWVYLIILGLALLFSCQPYTTMQIETIVPAKVEFPGNFNKIVFVNLETDLNHDDRTDTLLYDIITEEMSIGFMDAIQQSVGIDSTNFFYIQGFPNKNQYYLRDTISWQNLEKLSNKINSDIFIILDSMNLSMINRKYTDHYTYPMEYHVYRELAVNIYWSLYDVVERKRLDKFHYNDTLIWDVKGYIKSEVPTRMPAIERSIREASYFAAADYASRIFPGWQSETRYYFNKGNKDFEKAAQLINNNQWEEASVLWEKYTSVFDVEIASRACYNLAFYNEITGNMDMAIAWAEKSKDFKNKSRTRYYISKLKSRKKDLEKLQKQIY